MTKSPARTRFGRFGRLLAAFASAGVVTAAPVAAQTVTPEQAPAEWVRYATGATAVVTAWLQADTETAQRLRTYLDATRPAPDQPTAPLVIKLWIDADGTVSRIDHAPFAHAEANADMRALVMGQRLPAAPPKDMLLPLRVAVQLDAPAGQSEQASGTGTPAPDPRKLI